MAFDVTLSDKDRRQALIPDGQWHRLTIADLEQFAFPVVAGTVVAGEYDFELDLFGEQPATKALRANGLVKVQFVRLPSGDAFGLGQISVSTDYKDWHDVARPGRYVSADKASKSYATAFAVEYRTVTPNLVLVNRVLNADRRQKP